MSDNIDQHFANELKVLFDALAAGKPVLICFVVDGECRTPLNKMNAEHGIPSMGAMSGQLQKVGAQLSRDWALHGGPLVEQSFLAFSRAFYHALGSNKTDDVRTQAREIEDLEQ